MGPLGHVVPDAATQMDADGAAAIVTSDRLASVACASGTLESLQGGSCALPIDRDQVSVSAPVRVVGDAAGGGAEVTALMDAVDVAHILAAPFRIDEAQRGLLLVARTSAGHPFDADDEGLLRTLASRAGHTVENALLRRERDDLEDQLSHSTRELARAVQVRDDFFSQISHEFRTPLNAVLCYGELLHDSIFGELNAKQRDAVRRLQAAGQQLRELVDCVLEGDEPAHGTPASSGVASADLAEVVNEVVCSIQPEAERHGVTISVDGPERVRLEMDVAKVRRVLLMLCSKAITLTPRGPVAVHVRAHEDGGEIEMAVPEANAAAEPNEGSEDAAVGSTAPADTRKFDLSIARRIAARVGARVLVDDGRAGPSTVRLLLPDRVPATG